MISACINRNTQLFALCGVLVLTSFNKNVDAVEPEGVVRTFGFYAAVGTEVDFFSDD